MITQRLYSDADRRFFLIPDGLDLPSGDLELTSMTGQHVRKVDSAAALPFLAPRAEATAWLKAQTNQVLGQAQEGLLGWLQDWKKGREAPPWSHAARRAKAEAQPGLRLLAALSGHDVTELADDPAAVKAAGADLTKRLDAFLTRARDADTEAAREALREDGRRFVETVRTHGIAVSEATETMVDDLVSGLASGAFSEEARAAAARLEASFSTVDTWAEIAKHGLTAMATRLRRAAEATRPRSEP